MSTDEFISNFANYISDEDEVVYDDENTSASEDAVPIDLRRRADTVADLNRAMKTSQVHITKAPIGKKGKPLVWARVK